MASVRTVLTEVDAVLVLDVDRSLVARAIPLDVAVVRDVAVGVATVVGGAR